MIRKTKRQPSLGCDWKTKFQNDAILPLFAPQTAVLRLSNGPKHTDNPLHYILLVFKYCIYTSHTQ